VSGPPLAHVRKDCARHVQEAEEVRCEHTFNLEGARFLDGPEQTVARIVRENIDAFELSMPVAAASRACPSFVTSSGSLSNREWSAMDEGSRAVATTASPPARTASMMRAPNPRDAPVMNQVFMISHRALGRSEATWIVSSRPGLVVM